MTSIGVPAIRKPSDLRKKSFAVEVISFGGSSQIPADLTPIFKRPHFMSV